MATDRPSDSGVREISDFREARATSPREDRAAALRVAAAEFRPRFKAQGEARAVRTVDLVWTSYPAASAFHGAARGLWPSVTVITRLVVVQFEGFDGRLRTLAWKPAVPWLPARVLRRPEQHTVPQALARIGLAPGEVDLVAVDRRATTTGQAKPAPGETPALSALLPNARFALQRREVDALRFAPDALDTAEADRLVLVDGDCELGVGCALMHTPRRTGGEQSLCINTPEGIWLSSSNGVAADSWQPDLSKIAGVREWARSLGREVVTSAGPPEGSVEQYESMIKEKALADVNRRDPRWLNVLPCSELAPRRRQWPILPTFVHGGIDHGRIVAPAAPDLV